MPRGFLAEQLATSLGLGIRTQQYKKYVLRYVRDISVQIIEPSTRYLLVLINIYARVIEVLR